jgi:hypothetical protein
VLAIDFTATTSLDEVASVLQEKIRLTNSVFRNIIVEFNGTNFVFTSETFGSDSSFNIAAVVGGTGTDLTGANFLDGGSITAGTTGTLASVISGFLADNRYYHTILSNDWNDQEILEWASAIEASTKITYLLWALSTDAEIANTTLANDTGSIAKQLFDLKFRKTVLIFDSTNTDRKQASLPSYFGIVDFTSARPLGSLAFKQFSGISATDISDPQFENLVAKNVNFYANYGETGRTIAYKGRVPLGNTIEDMIAGDYIDYNQTYDIFDLMITLPKFAYIRADFAKLNQSMSKAPLNALSAGIIAGGTDPDTGEDLKSGFKIIIPVPSSISSQDRSDGIIKNIQTILLFSGSATKFVITNTFKI